MIKHIKIENYKSIPLLELDLGRVNVFIGENGCGKTNVLEAVALGGACSVNRLDHEFLASRGIRIAASELFKSGFDKTNLLAPIEISFLHGENTEAHFEISSELGLGSALKRVKVDVSSPEILNLILNGAKNINVVSKEIVNKSIKDVKIGELKKVLELDINENSDIKNLININIEKVLGHSILEKFIENSNIDQFFIFCPENTHLRRFDDEGQIRPLGIRGEGLFSHLADLARKDPEIFKKINETLKLIDWVEGFEIPNDLIFNERRIRIRDRYLDNGIQYIDQRSSNEGFLYLLFYVTLFISPYTPKFFAIDNIDNALNPRLCAKLIGELVRLAKENDKQVIVTAHNPGLLDGLNLNDEDQRLFVISRNKLGHTKALRIEQKPSVSGQEPVKLSEQFLRGYIGGIPNI